MIENSAKMVGMPLGPLQLVDETSIDLGAKIARATKAAGCAFAAAACRAAGSDRLSPGPGRRP